MIGARPAGMFDRACAAEGLAAKSYYLFSLYWHLVGGLVGVLVGGAVVRGLAVFWVPVLAVWWWVVGGSLYGWLSRGVVVPCSGGDLRPALGVGGAVVFRPWVGRGWGWLGTRCGSSLGHG